MSDKFQLHHDLQLVSVKHGVKLVPIDKANQDLSVSVGDILSWPFSTYFLNRACATEIINEEGAEVCGFDSVKDAVGKTLVDVSSSKSTRILIDNCSEVMSLEKTKVFEELFSRSDSSVLNFLSIKIPCYNSQDQMIGMMGCSIVPGRHALAGALDQLTQLGLLNQEKLHTTPAQSCSTRLDNNNIKTVFSPRERQCLELTIRGFSAKQIGQQLRISYRTVEEYLYNLRMKVGAHSKSELIQKTIDCFYRAKA